MAAITIEGDWDDLATKGFLVVRQLFDRDMVSTLCPEYSRGPLPDRYFLNLKPLGMDAHRLVRERVGALLCEVRAQTPLQVDAILKGYYVATTYVKYGWHQDFDVLVQDLVNYLNVYVPIVKPCIDKSNLSIVPFDALECRSPDVYRRLKGGVGNMFTRLPGEHRRCRVIDMRNHAESVLDLDIDALAVTPLLATGDALLLRADVIHKTQDADTDRVAVSIRAVNSRAPLTFDAAVACGRLLHAQRREADLLFKCLADSGGEEIQMRDFLQFASRVAASNSDR